MIFPVSAAMLENIGEYQDILVSFSEPRLDLIEWESTPSHNIEILNDTIDLYRYCDLTKQAEFLFECIEITIERIIPEELDYLDRYEQMYRYIDMIVGLPNNKIDLMIKYMIQNNGMLSKKRRKKEFAELSDEEISSIQEKYDDVYHS
jgi:hypothetical protein